MNNRLTLSLLLLLLSVYDAGAEVVKGIGKEFELSTGTRIISLAPSITEILYFLGLFDNIIGVTRYDDFPDGVQNKEIIGGYLDVDVEKVIRLKPDIVLCEPNSGIQESVRILTEKGIPVYVVAVRNISDILTAVEMLGKIFGKRGDAGLILGELTGRYLRIQRFLDRAGPKSGIIILNENPLMIAGGNTFVGELLGIVGIRNSYNGEHKYPVLDSEMLLLMKPDMIFNISEVVMSGGRGDIMDIPASLRSFLWEGTEFYNISDPSFIRPSPRFIDAVEKLCSLTTGYYCY